MGSYKLLFNALFLYSFVELSSRDTNRELFLYWYLYILWRAWLNPADRGRNAMIENFYKFILWVTLMIVVLDKRDINHSAISRSWLSLRIHLRHTLDSHMFGSSLAFW